MRGLVIVVGTTVLWILLAVAVLRVVAPPATPVVGAAADRKDRAAGRTADDLEAGTGARVVYPRQ